MFEFPVLNDDEMRAFNMFDPGVYDFQVLKAEQKVSSSGNPMVKLTLIVWDIGGAQHTVFDYLVATPKMAYKVKQFCDSTGLDYATGRFDVGACENRSGKLEIVIQKGERKDDGSHYPDKNAVKAYILIDASKPVVSPAAAASVEFKDDKLDDLPF